MSTLEEGVLERWPVGYAVWKMARPAQLLLICLVYSFGVAMAWASVGDVSMAAVVAGLTALLPTAASVHYVNEYADHGTDALTRRTPFSGGSGALSRTGLDPTFGFVAATVALGLGLLATAIVVASGLLGFLPVVLLSTIATLGWAYSVGPTLAWRGWGEVTNSLLGGIALPLYGVAVGGGSVTPRTVLAVLPFGLFVFANLLATQWPDRAADARVGKRTLATRWSRRRLRVAYIVAVVGSLSLFVAFPLFSVMPAMVGWSCLLVAPAAVVGIQQFTRRESPFVTVVAMVALAVVQFVGWVLVAVR
ncbi:prenyltransferase [Haloarchaeobius sp. TZWWS8]|uniref:prenyltransferase n=1 Tax=Haloarchaeobius sp. TZWWS8 TaxID=3446121 RepID=UPI003EBC3E21